jgi:hypothetical protein
MANSEKEGRKEGGRASFLISVVVNSMGKGKG